MALVIVSGLPSSGRTTRVEELTRDWQLRLETARTSQFKRIVHLTLSTLHLDTSVYAHQTTEKSARVSYLSLVQRNLASDAIVVADGGPGLNIKGFRYQLWCAAREVGLNCLSVLVTTHRDQCLQWNSQRIAVGKESYDEDVLEDLFLRFEEPNPMARWDSPLFVLSSDLVPPAIQWETPPYEDIWKAIVWGKVARAPPAVTHYRTTSSNYLSLLESSSQALVAAIAGALQQEAAMSVGVAAASMPPLLNLTVRSAAPTSAPVKVRLEIQSSGRPPTVAQLQRLRRQFVKMHSAAFASGNVLGKTAMEEGRSKGGIHATQRIDGQDSAEEEASPSQTSEEMIIKRFVSWLQEILPTL